MRYLNVTLHLEEVLPTLSLPVAYRLLRYSIAFIWLFTAFISTVVSPSVGYELLSGIGLHGLLADLAIYGTSALEVALGVCVIWGRFTRPLVLVQAALIVGFTGIIT